LNPLRRRCKSEYETAHTTWKKKLLELSLQVCLIRWFFTVNEMGNLVEQNLGNLSKRYSPLFEISLDSLSDLLKKCYPVLDCAEILLSGCGLRADVWVRL